MPYHYVFGDTFLCADADKAEVILVPKGQDIRAIAEKRRMKIASMICIDLWPIFHDLVRKLGGDPYAVIQDAYHIHSEADLRHYQIEAND